MPFLPRRSHANPCSDYRIKEILAVADDGMGAGLKRGEMARQTGCNLETIRYYEKTGLIAPPQRSTGGHRIYADADLRRVRFLMRARALGFTIEAIRDLLTLIDSGTQTCAEVKARTELHLADVRSRIADLRRIESVLAETTAQCWGDGIPQCAVLDAFAA
jgi:MerR family mercuric resistance operon transcriptional regulator